MIRWIMMWLGPILKWFLKNIRGLTLILVIVLVIVISGRWGLVRFRELMELKNRYIILMIVIRVGLAKLMGRINISWRYRNMMKRNRVKMSSNIVDSIVWSKGIVHLDSSKLILIVG